MLNQEQNPNSDTAPSHRKVMLSNNAGEDFEAHLEVQEWSDKEIKSRALFKTLKIVGSVILFSSLGLFVHILIPFIASLMFLTLLLSFPLYLKFLGDQATIIGASGTCPKCKKQTTLKPYLEARLSDSMTLQCKDCGETSPAKLIK